MKTWFLFAALTGLAACFDLEKEDQADFVTNAERIAAQPAPAPEAVSDPAEMPVPAAPSSGVLTADGWGELRIGMTREDIVAIYGPDANPGAVGGPEPDICDEFRPELAHEGVLLMLTEGTLARVSVIRDADIETDKGIGLGASADEVKAAYGDAAIVTPHKYQEAPAEYVTVWRNGRSGEAYVQDPAARGVRYVIGGDGAVEQIHAGGPAIQLVEGCS